MIKYILSFIPLVGTSVGAPLCTLRVNKKIREEEDVLVAVATGILSCITLQLFAESLQFVRSLMVYIGVLIGFLFVVLMNYFTKTRCVLNAKLKLFWAMLIHNIPEGIVVGVSLANDPNVMKIIGVIFSITLQDVPDGFIVSMSMLKSEGKKKAILYGIISGMVEPLAAILIIIFSNNSKNARVMEMFLIGFSFSTIFMVTNELLHECKNRKAVMISFLIALAFYSIFS